MMQACGYLKTVEFQCAVAELDFDTWAGEVKRLRHKKPPLTAAFRFSCV
jgi:hypothetical protein